MKRLVLLATGLLSVHLSAAEVLIDNVMIYDGQKDPYQADMLLRDGVIAEIGQNLTTTGSIIDGRAKTLSAGIFNGNTHLGVVEVGAIKDTVDYRSDNIDYTASLSVAEAINPYSVLIPYNRSLGLTRALVVPENDNHIFAGSAALIQLRDDQMILNPSVGMVVNLGQHGKDVAGGSRATGLAMLRTALDEAKEFAAYESQIMKGEYRDLSLSYHDLAALQPVLSGDLPLIVKADRAADILRVVELAQQYKLSLVLMGAREAWRVASELANAKVAVIMDPINNLPMGYDSLGARLDAAAILNQAGVELVFTGMGDDASHNAALVRQSAANAVAHGLPVNAAIKAITSTPARLFNAEKFGGIQIGQPADLVIWDGHPLEAMSIPEHVYVGGKAMSLVSRASRLADRYLQRIRAFQGN